jgi:hypothetical protein
MQEQAANAARTDAPARPEIDWSFADEDTLIRGMIRKEDPAWLEFMKRFDLLISTRVERVLVRRGHRLPWTDLVDTVHGDVTDYLYGNKLERMEPLRGFDSRHGTLATWVGRLAEQLTMKRLAELTTPRDRS